MSFDNPWQWSETAANNTAIASIDITGATGLVKNGDNAIRALMAQIITTEGKGSSVASAATLTLTGPERYFHITGSTGPITDIDFTDAVDGRWAWLVFDSTPTITHNATTLQLPGGYDITAAAGDRMLIVQDSSDNIICLSYVRASAVPQGWELISVQSPSGAASVDFTNLGSYRLLRLTGHLIPATDGETLFLRTSTNNGSSYDAGVSDYSYQGTYADGTSITGSVPTVTRIQIANVIGNGTAEGVSFTINLFEFNRARYCRVTSFAQFADTDGTAETQQVGGWRAETTARNAFQLIMGAGNMTGHMVLEGFRG